jgi:hypothetical protein
VLHFVLSLEFRRPRSLSIDYVNAASWLDRHLTSDVSDQQARLNPLIKRGMAAASGIEAAGQEIGGPRG